MPQTIVELFDAALALPESERAELAEMIAATVGESIELHPEWSIELRRRAAEVDAGKVRTIPWEEVRRQVHARLDGAGNG